MGELGDRASSSSLLVHCFDDTHRDCLAIFHLFPRTMINLLVQLSKLASDVSCVTIQHRCISSTDLAWMVPNNHPSCEASCFHWWVIFAVTSHIAMTNIFDRHILDIEAHVVPRKGFTQCFMVHFYRLHFSCHIDWSKGDQHARFENTSLHGTHRDSANTTDFIDILERQTQGFVSWASWWQDAIQSFKQSGSTGIAVLTGDFPSLEPWHVSTWLQHIVTIPARNWHKCYCVGVVASFLNVGADFLNSFLVSLLAVGWLSGIHFVNSHNLLFHTQSVSQKGMLRGLPVLGDTGFKFTNASSNSQPWLCL
ncbi:hypothetical protein FD754_004800 [Muntiacus muntjak]|uniref:Uncharacterized protein n=1 Tax=Muntiacus muntjak TaxID=9888 RepID=A0A5N3WGM9_MUNMU|nr:hypothetical protein FD754_004800 [Muntiacus muntjak]